MTDRESVEVAHEALLREWPRLREWIAARREALRLQNKVVDESRTWVRKGCQNAVRWQHELPDPARRLLADAGLLEAMERKTDVATAFCRWLSSRLGFEVRLPDEWEWQWAAQSARKGFVYPWGDGWQEGLANRPEAGIGRTTAVGMYPGGRSAQEAYDLADNVWEWCRNEYGEPNRTQPGGDVSRVLRGGSWFGVLVLARAGFRDSSLPVGRDDNDGFRVLCASPIR